MGSLSGEEYCFFDVSEDIVSISDTLDSHASLDVLTSHIPHLDVWVKSPSSVRERRSEFFHWMEASVESADQCGSVNSVELLDFEGDNDRIREKSGAVLRMSGFEDKFYSSRSMLSCSSFSDFLEEMSHIEDFRWTNETSGVGVAFDVDEEGQDKKIGEGCEAGSEQSSTLEDSDSASTTSVMFQQLLDKKIEEPNNLAGREEKVKKHWLSRLRSFTCVVDNQRNSENVRHDNDELSPYRVHRVKVRAWGKRRKDLSALYKGQDIQAHEGSILTMKFSLGGQYLASAGEDGIVRVWQVLEDKRSNKLDIPEIDPSCIYFTENHLSELKPLFVDKEKMGKLRSLRKTSDSACVVFPPKIFRLLEKPLHEFHGHRGEILDLSWSKDNHLLSASKDKTVCLWQVGHDHCLKVFLHSNYVTCVQFNPVDDNYFMSGSIDGKVRIWEIHNSQVVDWTDIKDMVTAVCYQPDGQGGIVGSMAGICCFYSMSDSHLQLDAQICLYGKTRSLCKRITGFQFHPQDPTKVMVTCADSKVRILHGHSVIGKYQGTANAANHISGCFTFDGKHIISACDDTNVYIWNCIGEENPVSLQAKKVKSYERFSANASVAIPWCGLKNGISDYSHGFHVNTDVPFSSPSWFSLSQEYFLESFPKGSATWPEEKLPTSPRATSTMHKLQYKFLKASCQSTANSHAWGLVIVTAGWDGRIRSFHNYGLPVMV